MCIRFVVSVEASPAMLQGKVILGLGKWAEFNRMLPYRSAFRVPSLEWRLSEAAIAADRGVYFPW